LQTAKQNEPVFEWDPATGQCLGLRIWDAVLNRLPSAGYTANANNWTNGVVGGTGSITSQTATNPANTTTNVNQISGLDSNSYVGVFAPITSSSNSNTASIFVKNNGGTLFQLRLTYQDGGTFRVYGTQYNFSTGAWQDGIGGTTAPAERGVQILPNGWFRFWVTGADNNSGNTRAGLLMFGTSATSSYNYYIWKAQINPGNIAPFVDTNGLSASTTADIASITGTNFTNIWNQTSGTIYGEATTSASSGPVFTARATASTGDRIQFPFGSGGQSAVIVSGNLQFISSVSTASKRALAFVANDFALVYGSTIEVDPSGTLPTVNYATIGKYDFGGQETLNGYIRTLCLYPSRLTNAQLVNLTS